MAEKNIAALLDEQAHTVQVAFTTDAEALHYTYVTDLDLTVGDVVVVPVPVRIIPTRKEDIRRVLADKNVCLKLAVVQAVDKTVDIPANDDKEYAWVIAKVDTTAHAEKMERNRQIERAVAQAYQRSLRKSFAERILGELAEDDRVSLLKLLGKS